MLTPVAHRQQPLDETEPKTAPAKAKGKAPSQAAASDFSQFVGQFLGTAAQNTQQTGMDNSAVVGRGEAAKPVAAQPAQLQEQQPAPQPASQPDAEASPIQPENAATFLGIGAEALKSPESPKQAVAAPEIGPGTGKNDEIAVKNDDEIAGTDDSEATLMQANSNEDHNKAAADTAAGADRKPADKGGKSAEQQKPDLHNLLGKQQLPGAVADKNKAGEPVNTDQSSTQPAKGDFSRALHLESSGIQNVQTQLGGAVVTHRAFESGMSSPMRAANSAEVLETAPAIVKDGNRLAVKFEQDGLGKLDIDLRLNKGIINAQIQVADDSTKTLIENNMQRIMDSLLQAGLSVGGFSVSLKGGGQQNMEQEEYSGKTGPSTERAGMVTALAPRMAASSLVSIFI